MSKQKELPKLPRGQGSFFYHSNDRIGYRRTFTYPSGRKEKKTVYGSTVDECLEKMKVVERDIDNDTIVSKDILYDAITKWLVTVKKNRLKPQSYSRYEYIIENQIRDSIIGRVQYQKITSQELQSFINSLNKAEYSYSTIQKCYNLLKAFYRYSCAVNNFNNPMIIVELPIKYHIKKDTKKVAWFEQEDIDKFIKEATRINKKTKNYVHHNGHMYSANIYLGLRLGELCALQWKDINLEDRLIRVDKTVVQYKNPDYDPNDPNSTKTILKVQEYTKTESNRFVPINSKALELILKHKEIYPPKSENDYVVCSKTGNLLYRHAANGTIKTIQKKAKTTVQDAASHTIRHTCASLYFRAGVRIEIIAKILGHSVETCRKIYVGLLNEQLQEASSQIVPIIEI